MSVFIVMHEYSIDTYLWIMHKRALDKIDIRPYS